MSEDQATTDTDKADDVITIEEPPQRFGGILRRLGPGLIVAGSIVGSGELIATTATGAQAGFWLLWLIIIGCVIKVFVQVELGRYSIVSGHTTLTGMNDVPGPKIQVSLSGDQSRAPLIGNWLLLYWVLVFIVSLGQLGGIVGGVGQALAISVPLTENGRDFNRQVDSLTKLTVEKHKRKHEFVERLAQELSSTAAVIDRLKADAAVQDRVAAIQRELQGKLAGEVAAARAALQQLRGSPLKAKYIRDTEAERVERLLLATGAFPDLQAAIHEDPLLGPIAQRVQSSGTKSALGEPHRSLLRIKPFKDLAGLLRDDPQTGPLVGALNQTASAEVEQLNARIAEHGAAIDAFKNRYSNLSLGERLTSAGWWGSLMTDDKWWALIVTVITAAILVIGRYHFIQTFSTVLVASFTLITIINLIALQSDATYAVTWENIVNGFRFQLTPRDQVIGLSPLATALATFGIIGVGGNELVSYPYWCLEKGYARFTGPRDDSPEWAERARGWLRVMRWDAWCSMIVYTFATIAFYLLGAAILHQIGLIPEGTEMIRTLAVMYEPVFGTWTTILFLFGAFAVLYSTFFVANASHARVFPDALRVCGAGDKDDKSYRRRIRFFSGLFPFLCLIVYIFFPKPTALVLASGVMQALLLPMLSFAALYFRYRRSDRRVAPGRLWDVFLWISAIGMLVAGAWLALTVFFPALKELA